MKYIAFPTFLLIAFVIYFLISLPIYSGDVKNHVAWGQSLLELGPYNFFDRTFPGYSFPTYPPLIMISFALSWGIYQVAMSATYFLNSALPVFPSPLVHWMEWENVWISFLKLPGLLGAIVFAGILPWVMNKTDEPRIIKNKYLIALIILINPAVIYVSSVWGQTDLIQNLFLILALGFTFAKRFWWGFLFAGVALMTKHTILLLWGVYMFYIFKEYGLKQSLKAFGVSLLIFYLSYLPFHSPSIIWPLQFYYSNFTLVDFGVAENAINFWGAVIDFGMAPSSYFWGVSYDHWGYILFSLFILPLTILFFIKKTSRFQLFYYFFLISGFYFFFFTRMHERYMIPVVLFATVLVCFKQKRLQMIGMWINLIFFTFLHFINVYRGLLQPTIPVIYDLTTSNQFLYFLVIGYGVLLLYNYTTFLKELLQHETRKVLFKW